MDILKQILELINKTPDDLNIYYSNINGEEQFKVNGVDILSKTKFDDSQIKKEVKNYKSVVEDLDDCLFLDIVEDIKQVIDIKTFDELLEQDSYTEEEASIVSEMISISSTVINEHVTNRIFDYQELLKRLS